MKILERGFIVVKPKQKFIDWANSNDQDFSELTTNEANVYLVEEDAYDDDVLLKTKFKDIFFSELLAVTEDEAEFPEITMESFHDHFAVSFGSSVFDLVD
jgi:hypothetical protein